MLDDVAYAPYADPDDFIREVTDRIWVQRDVGFIAENYMPDSIVHGGLGTTEGNDGVIAGSLMRIATAPLHVGQAEDVVWEARGDDAFLSSHLVFSSDPELVAGRTVRVRGRAIANCLYRRGRMVEEWLVRDDLARVLQRGLDPDEVARRTPFRGYSGSMTQPPPADPLLAGDSGPRPDDVPETQRAACAMVLEMVESVWNRRRVDQVHRYFDRDLFLHTVGDVTVTRPGGYQAELLRMLAPLPDGRFAVRDVQSHHAERYAGLRVAVMWVLSGAYVGTPAFGPLTGQQVDVLGVSQFLVQSGRIVREVRVYDEIALRAQIAGQRGDIPYTATTIY